MPENIVSDRDAKFLSKFWQTLFTDAGTTLSFSTSYKPSTDGQTENMNRQLQGYLRCFVNLHRNDWDELLPYACFAINTSKSATTGVTPFLHLYGQHARTPASMGRPASLTDEPHPTHSLANVWNAATRSAEKAQLLQKQYADRHRRDVSYSVGDEVFVNVSYRFPLGKPPKLTKPWDGPFRIVRKINDVAYELQLPPTWKIHNVIWVGYLKPAKGEFPLPPPPDYDEHGEPEYQIEAIVGHRTRYRKREYLVHWEGYSHSERTWEKEETLAKHADECLADYKREHQLNAMQEPSCIFCAYNDDLGPPI